MTASKHQLLNNRFQDAFEALYADNVEEADGSVLDVSRCIAAGENEDGRKYQFVLTLTFDEDDFHDEGYGEVKI